MQITKDGPSTPESLPTPKSILTTHSKRLTSVSIWLFYIMIFMVWEVAGRDISPMLFTYPTAIVRTAIEMIQTGELAAALIDSLTVLLQSLLISFLIGLPLGFALGRSPFLGRVFGPLVNALYVVPRVVFVPILVLWFGLTQMSRIFLVILASVFPLIFNATAGVRSISSAHVDVARAYGATEWQITKEVTLPAILPFIGIGVKQMIARGMTGLIVAEFFIGVAGLGGLLQKASGFFRTDKSFVVVLTLVVLGFALTRVGEYLESRLGRWRMTEKAY